MKEVFTVIASAWSTAFIVLFIAFAMVEPPGATDDAAARADFDRSLSNRNYLAFLNAFL